MHKTSKTQVWYDSEGVTIKQPQYNKSVRLTPKEAVAVLQELNFFYGDRIKMSLKKR